MEIDEVNMSIETAGSNQSPLGLHALTVAADAMRPYQGVRYGVPYGSLCFFFKFLF